MSNKGNKNTKTNKAKATKYPSRVTKNSGTYAKKASTKNAKNIKSKYDATNRPVHSKSSYKTHKKPEYNKKNIKTKAKKTDYATLLGPAIVILIGILALSYLTTGWEFTLVVAVGLALILGFSYLINKLRRKKTSRRILNVVMVLLIVVFLAVTSLGVWFTYTIITESPDFDTEKLKVKESTLLYDNNNELVFELGTEKREIITYEEISEELVNAIIATEDSRFFQHQGFDAPRFLKASLGQLSGNEDAGGGSTLSMQVIKNSFTNTETRGFDGIKRKFTDIYLSVFKLESNYTKQEIIEFYVNNHFLGSNAYGVEQASLTYFGKHAADINLSEAAIIAGMFQAPSAYNPFNNPESTAKRRAEVLSLMRRHGYITKEEESIANAIPVSSLLVDRSDDEADFQAYIDVVLEELKVRGYNPYSESLLIYTNMDRSRQKSLDDIFSGKTFDWVYAEVQSGVAAVDVNNGKILAIGAGRNRSGAREYNYATMSDRQIGSAAKPIFDYGPGIEYNNWSTYTLFYDGPYQYSSGQTVRNSDGGYRGTLTLRNALSLSRNIPALKAFQQVDNKKIIEFVEKLGIKPEIENGRIHEAHSLGAFNGSNPLEMAAAYAAFANGGTYYEPYSINKIVNRQTDEIKEFSSTGVRAMSDSTAFMVTDVLKTSVISGLSGAAKVSGINVAAKTGTTNFTRDTTSRLGYPSGAVHDAWVVGYDPEVSIGMWYGYPNLKKGRYLTTAMTGRQRARVFQAAGSALFKSSGKDFKVPNSVVRVGVEMGSNPAALASPGTPAGSVVYEYFKKGTEPTEVSVKYNKLSNVSGLKIDYDASTRVTSLSWNALAAPSGAKDEYGSFGYKIYKDGRFLGFTDTNSYNIRNDSAPTGSYKVVTTYEFYEASASSGASIAIDNISVSFKGDLKSTFNSTDASYDFANDVQAKRDGASVNTTATITVKDPLTGGVVSWSTAVSVPGSYEINYSIFSGGKQVGTLKREVEVIE